ncbi:hypothetical protein EXIGLDRAFT_737504, partial [Exidia glandulosa HHB12029]
RGSGVGINVKCWVGLLLGDVVWCRGWRNCGVEWNQPVWGVYGDEKNGKRKKKRAKGIQWTIRPRARMRPSETL